jgi:hypothetical protein
LLADVPERQQQILSVLDRLVINSGQILEGFGPFTDLGSRSRRRIAGTLEDRCRQSFDPLQLRQRVDALLDVVGDRRASYDRSALDIAAGGADTSGCRRTDLAQAAEILLDAGQRLASKVLGSDEDVQLTAGPQVPRLGVAGIGSRVA